MTVTSTTQDGPEPMALGFADYAGAWVAIAFFPPGLERHPELARFDELRGAFAEQGCVLLGASVDTWLDLHEMPASFPIVADTEGLLARTFGAQVDGERRFGTVLADPDGIVRWDDLGKGVSAARALAGLDRLRREAERPAA
jgi:alkyl hydroperoxide reductase subunit AhpC